MITYDNVWHDELYFTSLVDTLTLASVMILMLKSHKEEFYRILYNIYASDPSTLVIDYANDKAIISTNAEPKIGTHLTLIKY